MAKAKKPKQKRTQPSKRTATVEIEATDERLEKSLKATKWGKSELTKFLISAEQNTKITYLQQKGYFELFDKLAELFWRASQQVSYHDVATFAECLLFYRSIGSFSAAIRLGTAGQLPECYVQLRVCIESALYAFAIKEEPALGNVWINRHNDEKGRDLCRKSFSVSGCLKKLALHLKPLHAQVKTLYEECIDLGGHPNERSLTANIKFLHDNRGMVLELLNTQPGAFHVCLRNCCLAGISVTRTFAIVYPSQFAKVNANLRLTSIESQLQRMAPAILLDFV